MPNDVIQLEILGSAAGEPTANILHYERGTGSSSVMDMLVDFVDAWQAANEPAWMACCAADWQLLGYKAHRVNNGGSPTHAKPVASTFGTSSGNVVQASAGGLINAFYTNAGKTRAGKIFMPAAADQDILDNSVQTGYRANLNTLIGQLNTTVTGTGNSYGFVIWSRKFNLPLVPFFVEVSAKVGVQRRRLLPVF